MNKFRLLFVLLLCLIFSNLHAQNIIQVSAGTDGITAAYTAAVSGDIIELTTDGGLYTETTQLIVTGKEITIRAAAGLVNKPIWVCSYVSAYGGIIGVYSSVTVDGIILDGKGGTPATLTINGIIAKGNAGGYNITIKNCTFKNFTTGLYGSSSAQIDSVKVSNSIFQNLTGYGVIIYTCDATITAPGSAKYVSITNSTFANITTMSVQVEAKDDVIGTIMGDDPVVTIDHVTFYNSPRVLTHNCNFTTVRNCIYVQGTYSYYIYGSQSVASNNLYWNAPPSYHTAVVTNSINADPQFVNAAAGDFTIPKTSPAYNAGTDGKTLGDPRWWLKEQNVIQVASGTDVIAAAFTSAVSGDIIELTTDGGLYIETTKLSVTDKTITIRAAAGLVNKPIWACSAVSTTGGLLTAYSNVTIDGIILDGTAGSTATTNGIITGATAVPHNVKVYNSTFRNFATALYGSGEGQADTVIISNCIFNNLSQYGIIFYTNLTIPGSVKVLTVSNSTFSNITKEAFYIEASDGDFVTTPDPLVTITNVTFYNTLRVLIHYCNYATITNCIFMDPTVVGTSYYIYGLQSSCLNSLYWNAPPSLHTATGTATLINADPQFVNAAAGDFTIPKTSPANNAGTDGKTLGDPRWWWDNSVPVELSSFTAVVNTRNVNLNWETKTEVNSNNFEIERVSKSDATKTWTKVADVRGAGTSISSKQYSYIDKKVTTGTYQYRLKMIDNDGTYKYSPVVEAQIQLPTKFDVSQNYPNPFNPSTRIDYQLPFDSKVTIELYSISGQKVISILNDQQSAGYYTSIINTASMNLASGVYIYRIVALGNTGTNFTQSKKLVLLK